MSNTNNSTLTASKNASGWHVTDADGGVWWPGDEAQSRIDASTDPAMVAVQICDEEPTLGEWRD